MQQAHDFADESEALLSLLSPLEEADFETPTFFKGWSIDQILRHLHVWNIAADLSLTDEAGFAAFMSDMAAGICGGRLPDFEAAYLGNLSGQELLETWATNFKNVAQHFSAADPKARVKWVGPEMSAISSITARLMETWSHAQAIYDVLGVARIDAARIRQAASSLGVAQYCIDEAVKYARQRKPFGKPLAVNQAIQFPLVELATDAEMLRLLIYKTAAEMDSMTKPEVAIRLSDKVSMCNYKANRLVCNAADFAMQVHGGMGYSRHKPFEHIYRHHRRYRITEGAEEVQMRKVAGHLFGFMNG